MGVGGSLGAEGNLRDGLMISVTHDGSSLDEKPGGADNTRCCGLKSKSIARSFYDMLSLLVVWLVVVAVLFVVFAAFCSKIRATCLAYR